jgi:Na+/H+ antiporter NhaC
MLIAERKTQVYGRTDGGDGATGGPGLGEKHNQPEPDTPGRVWNMFIPIIVIVILIIWLLIQSGVDPSVPQTVIDMLQNSDSYSSLLYGAFASAWLTLILYHIQFREGRIGDPLAYPTSTETLRHGLV